MFDAKEYAVGEYDEGGMIAGMEQDFERLIEEKDNEIDMLRDELKTVKEAYANLEKSVRQGIKKAVLGML